MSEAKYTPGPWRWEVNEKHKTVQLVGGVPKYDLTVMGFKRWGMHDAVATMRDPEVDGMNIMHRCTDWAHPVPGREHHASWLKTIDHPDARLIAAAPDLLEALEELVSEAEQSAFEQWVERVSPSGDADFVQHQWNVSYDRDEFLGLYEKQIAAIAKAKGESTC